MVEGEAGTAEYGPIADSPIIIDQLMCSDCKSEEVGDYKSGGTTVGLGLDFNKAIEASSPKCCKLLTKARSGKVYGSEDESSVNLPFEVITLPKEIWQVRSAYGASGRHGQS